MNFWFFAQFAVCTLYVFYKITKNIIYFNIHLIFDSTKRQPAYNGLAQGTSVLIKPSRFTRQSKKMTENKLTLKMTRVL